MLFNLIFVCCLFHGRMLFTIPTRVVCFHVLMLLNTNNAYCLSASQQAHVCPVQYAYVHYL